jgi:hypothetical protein
MKIDEIISKSELFAMNFIAKINDKTEQPTRKQIYFLDNQDELQKYMDTLQKIVIRINNAPNVATDDAILADKANDIVKNLKDAISEFQKELVINDNITEQDTTVSLTKETISDAMKTNKTTQEISKNMQTIINQNKATQINYNYALVCDGNMNLLYAEDKDALNKTINDLTSTSNFKNVQLYELNFKEIPLKKKVVFGI